MIKKLITEYAPLIKDTIDPEALLWAIYEVEKYSRHNRQPRFEAAYAPGGIYFKNSSLVRREVARWDRWASCSYSNFQIMYITACELGYEGPPLPLDKDSVALPYVTRYVNLRIIKRGAKTIADIADAYNSGTHRDIHVPTRYINKFERMYAKHHQRLEKERHATI